MALIDEMEGAWMDEQANLKEIKDLKKEIAELKHEVKVRELALYNTMLESAEEALERNNYDPKRQAKIWVESSIEQAEKEIRRTK